MTHEKTTVLKNIQAMEKACKKVWPNFTTNTFKNLEGMPLELLRGIQDGLIPYYNQTTKLTT